MGDKVKPMNPEQAKTATKALKELNESYIDLLGAVKSTGRDAEAAKKLWREGNKSRLIRIGVALILFPEPTPISEIIGLGFLAAGAVQKGIQNQSIYMEDIPKSLKSAFKEIYAERYDLRI